MQVHAYKAPTEKQEAGLEVSHVPFPAQVCDGDDMAKILCCSAMSFERDVKQGCSLCMHALKFTSGIKKKKTG